MRKGAFSNHEKEHSAIIILAGSGLLRLGWNDQHTAGAQRQAFTKIHLTGAGKHVLDLKIFVSPPIGREIAQKSADRNIRFGEKETGFLRAFVERRYPG